MSSEPDRFKPRPRIALVLTGVIVVLAVEDQLVTGSIDSELVGALIFLVAFWTGQGVGRWLG